MKAETARTPYVVGRYDSPSEKLLAALSSRNSRWQDRIVVLYRALSDNWPVWTVVTLLWAITTVGCMTIAALIVKDMEERVVTYLFAAIISAVCIGKLYRIKEERDGLRGEILRLYGKLGQHEYLLPAFNPKADLSLCVVIDHVPRPRYGGLLSLLGRIADCDTPELWPFRQYYQCMKEIDELLLESLDDVLLRAFEEPILAWRKNILRDFYGEWSHGRELYYEDNEGLVITGDTQRFDGEEVLLACVNDVLNAYYFRAGREQRLVFTYDRREVNAYFIRNHRKEWEAFAAASQFEEEQHSQREAEKHGAVIAECNMILAGRPGDADALDRRANAEFMLGKHEQAIADWTLALQQKPDKVEYAVSRGWCHEQLGDLAKAQKEYEWALQVNPRCREAYCSLGDIFVRRKEYEAALAVYTEAINLDPASLNIPHNTYSRRAEVCELLGRYDAAVEDYSTIISINATFAGPYYKRGLALKAMKRYIEAANDLRTFLRMREKGDIRPEIVSQHLDEMGMAGAGNVDEE